MRQQIRHGLHTLEIGAVSDNPTSGFGFDFRVLFARLLTQATLNVHNALFWTYFISFSVHDNTRNIAAPKFL